MPVVRPFRALRIDPKRAAVEQLVWRGDVAPSDVADTRHMSRVTAPEALPFLLVDLVRAGVVVRDALPSLTVVRITKDDTEHTHLYGALSVEDVDGDASNSGGVDVVAVPAVVRYQDKKGRIGKALDNETDREPDCAFTYDGAQVEAWIVDDESVAARVTSLIEAGAPTIAAEGSPSFSALRAQGASFSLAVFVERDDDVTAPLAGLVLLSVRGALHVPVLEHGS